MVTEQHCQMNTCSQSPDVVESSGLAQHHVRQLYMKPLLTVDMLDSYLAVPGRYKYFSTLAISTTSP